MMPSRRSVVAAVLVAALLVCAPLPSAATDTKCLVCTLLVGLIDQWLMPTGEAPAFVDLKPLAQTPSAFCNGDVGCETFLQTHGDELAIRFPLGESPDDFCRGLKLCTQANCTLFKTWPVTPQGPLPPPTHPHFPPSQEEIHQRVVYLATLLGNLDNSLHSASKSADFYDLARAVATSAVALPAVGDAVKGNIDPCGFNVTCLIHRVFDQHLPFADSDNDLHSPPGDFGYNGFRGGNWRGRDCNDSDPTIYSGRKVSSHPPSIDHNCNGIYGVDPTTGQSYEDMYCKDTDQRGLVILGDSAAAHFHIPPAWIRGKDWNLDDLIPTAADELDWPQCSWSTGFLNTSSCPISALPMASVYQRLYERNRCNFRDFQNLGVNGARTTSMAPPGIINGLSRRHDVDHPALVFYALIGNDVCNGHPGTGHMTTPSEFKAAVLKSLQYLDTTLPANSSVVFIGLVDGRVLWDTMHDKIHPIGVPYPDVYEFLSCNSANPCWGWLNSNATWRNITTQHAESLNAVYPEIIKEQSYANFKMYFHNPDWFAYIEDYVKAGGVARDLIEPVDGFHPSQSGHQYLAMNVWNYLEQNIPEVLGPVNPHNDAIKAKFGDQGGYN